MNWLARLKDENAHVGTLQNLQKHEEAEKVIPTKPTKHTKDTFVGFVGSPPGHIQKTVSAVDWPPAPAEIDIARLALFTDRGLSLTDGQALVDRLTLRDQQRDDRRVCLECAHLSGTVKARRCGQWRKTGMQGPPTPADLVDLPQRCAGFTHALKQMAPSGVPRSS